MNSELCHGLACTVAQRLETVSILATVATLNLNTHSQNGIWCRFTSAQIRNSFAFERIRLHFRQIVQFDVLSNVSLSDICEL